MRAPGCFHGVAFEVGARDDRFLAERAELLSLLRTGGILRASATQPVLSGDGKPARWMLDSLAVSLSPRGAELAGRCLLPLCARFDGRQIATYGVTAIPLLQATILASSGRYRGLIVREERKKHGAMKLIEGPLDPSEPVILLDDSVVSGTSMSQGIAALEAAGLRVEGGVCLVRFGYSGVAGLQERGYHMEALYDIWEDFIAHMPDEEPPLRNPTKAFPPVAFGKRRAAAGMHPAVYARQAIEHWLRTETLLRPPAHFDRDHDSRGGAWVSLRRRDDLYDRLAREGFWHLPGEERGDVGDDIARAAQRAAVALPAGDAGCEALAACHVAVTLFSALEACTVAGLDNDRYGIVVCSRERSEMMGGALPRMPGIGTEWQQLEHARRKNGELLPFEPFALYRHDVVKLVEPGAAWQPTGVPIERSPVWHDPAIGGVVAARALDLVRSLRGGVATTAPLSDDLLPGSTDSIYVTVHVRGRLRGCVGGTLERLDDDLRQFVEDALCDRRFPETDAETGAKTDDLAVSVSILHDALELGEFSPEELMVRVRLGEQAVMVWQGDRLGLLLPFVAVRDSLDPVEFAREVIDKAGITRPPYDWCRFECVTWLAAESLAAPARLSGALLPGTPPASIEEAVERFTPLLVDYVLRHQRADGTFFGTYAPFSHTLDEDLAMCRLAHAGWTLARGARVLRDARLAGAADRTLAYLTSQIERDDAGRPWVLAGEDPPSIAEVAFVLLALLEDEARDHELARSLAATLWSCIDDHGRFHTHRDRDDEDDAFQDYFPGEALLALARAAETGIHAADGARLRRASGYYRHRFRYHRSWGQVSWLMQAFAAWHRVTGEPDHAALVFEIGEATLAYQLDKNGGFANELLPEGPGFTTALFLEGIAAAAGLAQRIGDAARAGAFRASLARGLGFLDRLIYQPRDALLLPEPSWALGGVRVHERASAVRIDFVQHALAVILDITQQGGRA